MEAISIKDYAYKKGISYQAVNKAVHKYKAELEGHISIQNRTQFLDETAQKILDDKRKVQPIVVIEETYAEEVKKLNDEISEKNKIIMELQEQIIAIQKEEKELIEYKVKNEFLIEDKKQIQSMYEDAKKEADSFEKTIFGLYRKKQKPSENS